MRSGFQDLESWKEFSLMRDSLIRNSSRTLISDFLPSDDENIDMEDEFPVEWFETDSIDEDWIVTSVPQNNNKQNKIKKERFSLPPKSPQKALFDDFMY